MQVLSDLNKKRVAAFYRVSTKGQLDGDDIPMQRRACQEFIEKQGWVLVKEYIEKGISGFKVSANKRDEIQRAKIDAEAHVYDVLLVFMFDRLGRRDDETPFVMKWFAKKGIELWSTKEGQQKFEDHSDELINYIRFWQSSGESKKTSMRVNEKHSQMVEDGYYRGGTAPFGYKLVESGVKNKKGKELYKLEIDDHRASVVRKIYNMVYELGYGSNRIAKSLNEQGILTGTGSGWVTGAINYILRNPIYKGYMVYGKRKSDAGIFTSQSRENWILSKEAKPELIIIEEEVWDKVQDIRTNRSPEKVKDLEAIRYNVSKSPLLFVGLARCGHCYAPLTTTYNTKTYKLKNGTVKKCTFAKYRCSGKALGKSCGGQTVYAQQKIESVVQHEIYNYLEQFKHTDVSKEVDEIVKNSMKQDEQARKLLQREKETILTEINTLNGEVANSLMGKSAFKPELLGKLISQKDEALREIETKLKTLESKIENRRNNIHDLELLKKHAPVWKEIFDSSPFEKKKMMVHAIIKQITVYRDKIEILIRLHVKQFISGLSKNEVYQLPAIHEGDLGFNRTFEKEIAIRK
ncbi:recombinase family protein [Cohnella zeiphila]|uniref:Recombinase family protein n=1 Tax=Cohnella zeiphila TaxID=2761120 RepID=A0A7X0SMX8_9BACL|nr:recombinase family protein [Cohnella zeiphila]MBB6732806.1 recombinase family protein [Cohnella zeiphila]